jgi:BirA family transcriptional regulator, biotin operon repressor / biotin---[acetyl-CoA-carboxylase] ligase
VSPRRWEEFGWTWEGASSGLWARRLGLPRLEVHWEVDSTNQRLLELARDGAPPFTTVVAVTQRQGRGRGGRSWHSPPGAGLWMSCLLPTGAGGATGVLPLAVGVATARMLERVTGVTPQLKWPNDLLFRSAKLAGILCELPGERASGIVVGVGINLRRPPEGYPVDFPWGVAFLEEAAGIAVREPELVQALVAELREWAHPPPTTLSGPLRREWESRDFLKDRGVRLAGGARGWARSVSARGRLVVEHEGGGRTEVLAGGVELDPGEVLRPPSGSTLLDSEDGRN